jgi:hypothetical protein
MRFSGTVSGRDTKQAPRPKLELGLARTVATNPKLRARRCTGMVRERSTARRQPIAREHAIELFQFLQQQRRFVGKWILARDLENVVYPHFLACLGWAPRPWVGRNGVAKHLGELTVRSCKRVEVAGSTRNWAAFLVPGKTARRSWA